MRIGTLVITALVPLLFAAASEAKNVSCPPAGELTKPGERYEGALSAIEMRTPTTGDQKGEATLVCFREVGNVSFPGGRCRFIPGPGGRIAAQTDANMVLVRCTILGGSPQSNERACMIVCD